MDSISVISGISNLSLGQDEVIDVSKAGLKSLDDAKYQRDPSEIHVLKAKDNLLTKISKKSTESLSQLQFLDLSGNQLTEIGEIGKFQNLILLDLSRNRISVLENLEKMQNLKRLLIARNLIQNVILKSPIPQVVVLDLHRNPLKSIDFGDRFPGVTELYIDRCLVSSLHGIEGFSSLLHLTAAENKIDHTELINHPFIQDIDLSFNKMTTIAPFYGMKSLIYLNVSSNLISDKGLTLPGQMPALRAFRGSDLRITRPSLLLNIFPNVEIVDLSRTDVSSLDDVILFVRGAPMLRYLDLRGTPLTAEIYPLPKPRDQTIFSSIMDFDDEFPSQADARHAYRVALLEANRRIEILDHIKVTEDEYVAPSPLCSALASSSVGYSEVYEEEFEDGSVMADDEGEDISEYMKTAWCQVATDTNNEETQASPSVDTCGVQAYPERDSQETEASIKPDTQIQAVQVDFIKELEAQKDREIRELKQRIEELKREVDLYHSKLDGRIDAETQHAMKRPHCRIEYFEMKEIVPPIKRTLRGDSQRIADISPIHKVVCSLSEKACLEIDVPGESVHCGIEKSSDFHINQMIPEVSICTFDGFSVPEEQPRLVLSTLASFESSEDPTVLTFDSTPSIDIPPVVIDEVEEPPVMQEEFAQTDRNKLLVNTGLYWESQEVAYEDHSVEAIAKSPLSIGISADHSLSGIETTDAEAQSDHQQREMHSTSPVTVAPVPKSSSSIQTTSQNLILSSLDFYEADDNCSQILTGSNNVFAVHDICNIDPDVPEREIACTSSFEVSLSESRITTSSFAQTDVSGNKIDIGKSAKLYDSRTLKHLIDKKVKENSRQQQVPDSPAPAAPPVYPFEQLFYGLERQNRLMLDELQGLRSEMRSPSVGKSTQIQVDKLVGVVDSILRDNRTLRSNLEQSQSAMTSMQFQQLVDTVSTAQNSMVVAEENSRMSTPSKTPSKHRSSRHKASPLTSVASLETNTIVDEIPERGVVETPSKISYPSHLNPHMTPALSPFMSSADVSVSGSSVKERMNFGECERAILFSGRNAVEKPVEVHATNSDFKTIHFWLSVSFRQTISIRMLTKFATSRELAHLENKGGKLFLVLYPCDNPVAFAKMKLPSPVTVYRYLSRMPKPIPRSFLLCAADLGNQCLDNTSNSLPSEHLQRKLVSDGYDSLIYTRNGIESVRVFRSSNIVPLFSVYI